MSEMGKIIIHEVGPRDGLQVEDKIVPTEQKIRWIEELIKSGIDIIQLGSFVNPKRIPQMADTDDLFKYFNSPGIKTNNVILSGLVLNEKGLERAMACGVEMFCMGVSASGTHSMKNTGMNTEEALKRVMRMAKEIIHLRKKVQLSVQSAFGCGYEGKISESKVLDIVKKYIDSGIRNISLADTSGYANPDQVEKLFEKIKELDNSIELACHFHDTYGLGIANSYVALKTGVKYFESSFAGLGGCPTMVSASGNICTEDFVHMLQNMNLRKDIDLSKIIEVTKDSEKFFKRELPGVVYKRGIINNE